MFKNFKKYPKGKKTKIIIALCALTALIGVIVYEVVKPAPLPEYELVKAEKGNILETFVASGTVESGNPSVYNIVDGVEVLEVKVKVGDKVKTGDLLATFDTSGLTPKLNELRSEYSQALSKYNEAKSDSGNASSDLDDTNDEIAKLEKQIARLEKDIEATRKNEKINLEKQKNNLEKQAEDTSKQAKDKIDKVSEDVSEKAKEASEKVSEKDKEVSEKVSEKNKEVSEKISEKNKEVSEQISEKSKEISEQISENSSKDPSEFISEKSKEISEKISEATTKKIEIPTSADDIKQYTGTVYSKEQIEALKNQILENNGTKEQVNTMIEALNEAEKKAKRESKEITTEELAEKLKSTSAGKSLELIQLKTQLASLKTQQTYFKMQSGDTIAKVYKAVADIKKQEYEQYRDIIDTLDAGWYADGNGIVTKVNITQGEIFTSKKTGNASNMDFSQMLNLIGGGNVDITEIISQLTSSSSNGTIGIQIDNYDSFIASFNVGKYDLLNLKVGQKAKVTSLDSEYEGVVDYVSATASENTGLDISSIANSLTGGSTTSNTALAKVKILKPDEKVIIGFDVDIAVNIGKVEDVLVLPVEALRFENGQKYVFVYDEKTKTVEKRTVELGSSEDTKYEITDGVSVGEMIVKNPLSALKDGDKIIAK